jgi:hypothetical protein
MLHGSLVVDTSVRISWTVAFRNPLSPFIAQLAFANNIRPNAERTVVHASDDANDLTCHGAACQVNLKSVKDLSQINFMNRRSIRFVRGSYS